MAIIKPFEAVRPQTQYAVEVVSLPYDVMNSAEAREMAEGNPRSFLHVSRAEIDFTPGTDEHTSAVYEKARDNFYRLIADGVLFQDAYPHLYIYSQTMLGRTQTGLVACSSIEDYFTDVIKKHELTRPEKEEDRIRHMETLQAHVGPIFLTYPKHQTIDNIITEVTETHEPVYDILTKDGIKHTVWLIRESDKIENLVAVFKNEIPFTYIADGHHRTASAAKVGLKLKQENQSHDGTEEYNFFLSVLFPDDQLQIMDYNRVVKDLNGLSDEAFIGKIKNWFDVSGAKAEPEKPSSIHRIEMYLSGNWYTLSAKPDIIKQDPIGVLDVTVLDENILKPILGIKDVRTDKRIDFVGGIRGLAELQRRIDNGEMKVAFALYPVSLKQLMDIADSGKIMPPKSTWFEPKLRDGFFSHLF